MHAEESHKNMIQRVPDDWSSDSTLSYRKQWGFLEEYKDKIWESEENIDIVHKHYLVVWVKIL